MKKVLSLFLSGISLCGCTLGSNNFSKFEEKLGVTMPTKYKKAFHSGETSIDSQLKYDIYEIKDDWQLNYSTQFVSDFEEEFDLLEYIDLINTYAPLKIPVDHYIPSLSSLDWVCKREEGSTRNYEWLLIFNSEIKNLYALYSTHQWVHQAIPSKS